MISLLGLGLIPWVSDQCNMLIQMGADREHPCKVASLSPLPCQSAGAEALLQGSLELPYAITESKYCIATQQRKLIFTSCTYDFILTLTTHSL